MRIRGRLARLERGRLDQSKRPAPFPPVLTDAERLARMADILASEPQNEMERRRKDALLALWERVRERVDGASILNPGSVQPPDDSPTAQLAARIERIAQRLNTSR